MKLRRLNVARSLLLLSALGVLATAGTSAASVQSHKKKLSQPNVTVFASDGSDTGAAYIAYHAGYYKAQGLNVTYLDPNGTGYPALTTAFLGGAYQFFDEVTSTGLVAVQAAGGGGNVMKAIVGTDIGQQIEIMIPNAYAAAHSIPLTGNTKAQSLKQFMALKGTHMTLAVSGLTTGAGLDTLAACRVHGLVCGLNQPNADINLISAGSTSAALAAVLAGKYNALGSVPPTTVQTGSIDINMGNITPISDAAGLEFVTTPAEIKAHPDTVQAFVTGTVQGWAYAKKFPAAAKRYLTRMFAEYGVSSPDTAAYLFQDEYSYWHTPLLLLPAYQNIVKLTNLSGVLAAPITTTYGQFNDNRFVNKAVKQLGLTVPTTLH